jgi:hypothetical protein
MAPYDPYAEAFTPAASPLKSTFVPQEVAHLNHIATSGEMPTDNDAVACSDGAGMVNQTKTPQDRSSSLPSPLPHFVPGCPKLRATVNAASNSRPVHQRSAVSNPRFDVEDGTPDVCPCCHLRRRSSAETAEVRSPKYIHTALDDCCGNFCPDLSLSGTVSSPTTHPHIGHSRLCEQVQSPHDFASDQLVEPRETHIPPDELFGRQCG